MIAVAVNYNGGAFLGRFLDSFRALTYPNAQLIVVDNASPDQSWRLVERHTPEATLLRSARNTGFTGGANLGAREALRRGADYVLFLNSDTRLAPDLIERLLTEATPRTMVAPRVLLEGTDDLLDDTAGEFSWLRGAWKDWTFGKPAPPSLRRTGPVAMASLTALLVPVGVFHEAGWLDERLFMYYEDFDFVHRAQRAGFALRLAPAARLWHARSASSGGGESAFKYYYATRNRLWLLRRHQPPPLFAAFCAYFVATRLVRAAQYAARRRPDLARAILAGATDFFRGRMGMRRSP